MPEAAAPARDGAKEEKKAGAAYEPTLVTAPADPRIQHLMAVIESYQRVTSPSIAALGLADWNGAFTLGSRSPGWKNFLSFLGVPGEAHEAASTAPDHHWYSFTDGAMTMRHEIPAQNLDLHYCAKLDGEWRTSPYSKPTSTHWTEEEWRKQGFRWRNRWLSKPLSLRCEWENRGGGEGSGHGQPKGAAGGAERPVTSVTVMERHLVSRDLINFRVWVYRAGGDPDCDADILVPRTGVTYIRRGEDVPEPVGMLH